MASGMDMLLKSFGLGDINPVQIKQDMDNAKTMVIVFAQKVEDRFSSIESKLDLLIEKKNQSAVTAPFLPAGDTEDLHGDMPEPCICLNGQPNPDCTFNHSLVMQQIPTLE
jgi:hypothetical protein